ncbi:MAG TPA: nickel-binding protein [Polyangiaceae bacterium]|nr:nickel-binding protein [Polyangiaceae bacterium]
MELVIVERLYEIPVTDEQMAELARRAGPCLELRGIRRLTSYRSKDRLRAICVYEAPDAGTVREAHDQQGVAYAKIWSADLPPGSEHP